MTTLVRMPDAIVSVKVDPIALSYSLESIIKSLEHEILESGYEPTRNEHIRMAGLATAAKVLAELMGAWRDVVVNGDTPPLRSTPPA